MPDVMRITETKGPNVSFPPIADIESRGHSQTMKAGPSSENKRALWIALIGLCLQVPLALGFDYLTVRLWAGSEPFGYRWREFVFIALATFLVQWWWLRSPRRAARHPGKYLWLAVFWLLAFIETMIGL